jgi:hypothetical protein
MSNKCVNLSQATQHRRNKQAGESSISNRQAGEIRRLLDRIIKRTAASKHRAQKIYGHAAGRRSGRRAQQGTICHLFLYTMSRFANTLASFRFRNVSPVET